MAMLKRLFMQSQVQKIFETSKIDKTHEMMYTNGINSYACRFLGSGSTSQNKNVSINININNNINNQINININNNIQKSKKEQEKQLKKDQLIHIVLKKIRSSSDVLRIKALIVAHSIVRKTFHQEFMAAIVDEVEKYIVSETIDQHKQQKTKENQHLRTQNLQKEFIQKNVISFYCHYIKKFIMNIETFNFAQKYLGNPKKQNYNIIQVINHGFVILNLCNYILQSQYTFNKMGRYYIQYTQILNLFIMYLNDMIVYNSFVKELSKLSVKTIKNSTNQQIRHHFLFVNESQKTSDRLYEFFYNRYYYNQVKKIILMPTFLNIHNDQYNELANYVKKNDPQLAHAVKYSKFDSHSRSRSKTFATDLNDKSFNKLNKTSILINKREEELLTMLNFMQKQNVSVKDLQDLQEVIVKKITIPRKQ